MRRLHIMTIIWAAVWFFGFAISTAHADIYTWTDENGVRVFTNYSPPENATLFLETPEITHPDEVAESQYLQDEGSEESRQDLVERVADLEERQKDAARRIAEREASLRQKEQEAEARIAEADERAAAALLEAEQAREEAARASLYDDEDRSTGYIVRYYPYYGFGYRSHYYGKNRSFRKGGIHFRKHYLGDRRRLHVKRPLIGKHKNAFTQRLDRRRPQIRKPFIGNHKNTYIQRYNRKQHISRQRFGMRGRHPYFQARFNTFRGEKRRF